MEAFILILVIAGAAMTVAAVKSAGDNSDGVWKAAAQRLGLRFEHTDISDGPTISGTRRGLTARIDTYAKSGDISRTYTRYRVRFKKSLGLGLHLTRRGSVSGMAKKHGTQDILTGDQDFDEAVVVTGRNPQKIVELLTPARKLRTVRFLMVTPDSTIDDVKIESKTRDVERSPDRIVQTIQRMIGLAEHLTADDDSGTDYLESTAPQQNSIEVDHASLLPYSPDQDPIPVVSLFELERDVEPVYEKERTEFYEMSDNEVKPAPPSSVAYEGIDIASVVSALFARDRTTSQATELFENLFKGHGVAWSGTLTNVRTFRFDLVFGVVPGTRAEFHLLDATDCSVSGRVVKAVVQFPTDTEDALRALVDRRVTFQGVLFSCDAFMKTMFLTDGEIVEVDA